MSANSSNDLQSYSGFKSTQTTVGVAPDGGVSTTTFGTDPILNTEETTVSEMLEVYDR